MDDAPPVDWTQRFVDRALERDFRAYQERESATSLRVAMPSAIVSWVIAHVAIGVLAPDALAFASVWLAALVYPAFVGTWIASRRATTPARRARLQHLMIVADAVACAAILALALIRLELPALALGAFIVLLFDVAIPTRRRVVQSAPVMIVLAASFQAAVLERHAAGVLSTTAVWVLSIGVWGALQHAIMVARATEQTLRAAFLQERTIAAQHEVIREEKVRSEALLRNILPEPIAAKLRDDPTTIADQFEEASVLFADVSGFTAMSAGMTAAEVVAMLNEVFSEFDALVERAGVEKIKTIGDCYMVAAGVPEPRADHAQALVGLALDMRDLVAARTFAGKQLTFRFGIHSGPVVAGVIGRRKFIYDLWGDTVNTASRMESLADRDTLQVTEQTRDLVRDTFLCEPLGAKAVKGKGELQVWRVTGRV